MGLDTKVHNRKSIRLRDFDYSKSGAYFITLCIKNKDCLFGSISKSKVILSTIGCKAKKYWEEIPEHFDNVMLDEYIIMPNHIHGIICIINEPVWEVKKNPVGVQYIEPLHKGFEPLQSGDEFYKKGLISSDDIEKKNEYQKLIPGSIGSIIRTFKASVTRWCNANGYTNFKWQRNYYDRIIRNEKEMNHIRQYIFYNPVRWMFDSENPGNSR